MDNNEFKSLCDQLVTIKHFNGRKNSPAVNNCIDGNPRITVKHPEKPCDDCGQLVSGRVVQIIKGSLGTYREHWAKKCLSCKVRARVDEFDKTVKK